MDSNNTIVAQLMEITQLTEAQARLYLEIYGDNLEVVAS
jgi:UBA-like domain